MTAHPINSDSLATGHKILGIIVTWLFGYGFAILFSVEATSILSQYIDSTSYLFLYAYSCIKTFPFS